MYTTGFNVKLVRLQATGIILPALLLLLSAPPPRGALRGILYMPKI